MALDLTPEQKTVGANNFQRVVGKLEQDAQTSTNPSRREFMQGLVGVAAAGALGTAAYFGYGRDGSYRGMRGRPIKAGLIGCGDEGGVLVSDHDPNYVEIAAISDIRPSNIDRIFVGEGSTSRRRGLNFHYGSDVRRRMEAGNHIHRRYQDLLADREIEMVIIALPLNLHHQATIDAVAAGKHVLCEKLMAWNITQCKDMIARARTADKLLSIGHQRHYSMLYAHANEVVKSGVLGDVRHIRALWHRNNAVPLLNASGQPMTEELNGRTIPLYRDSWRKNVDAADRGDRDLTEHLREYGWRNLNELIRWRLFRRTGGGLMAELGSHQLDACSIFLGKVHPISVTAVGGKNFYKDEREVEDNVYCTFEFPGPNYDPAVGTRGNRDERGNCVDNDIITVTYSSISTNSFESYGECVMGSKGTLITETEKAVYLYGTGGRSTEVTATAAGGRPALEASSSTAPAERAAQAVGASSLGQGPNAPVSFGYTEEMSHLAYCIRMRNEGMARDRNDPALKPRCDGTAAMADAIIALTANQAMRSRQRIEFQESWFNPESTEVPDGNMTVEPV